MRGVTVSCLHPDLEEGFLNYVRSEYSSTYILANPQYRKWQFSEILVAHSGGRVIGHLGYRDLDYWHGREIPVRVSMNFNVCRDFRSTGMGGLLMSRLTDTERFILGSGYTEPVQRLIKRLRPNWESVGTMSRYVAFMNDHPIINEYKGVVSFSKIDGPESGIRMVDQIDESFDELWVRIRDTFGMTVARNISYLNWRFVSHPFFDYRIRTFSGERLQGFIIFRIERSGDFQIARIVDLMSTDMETARILLSGALQEVGRQGVHAIDYLSLGNYYDQSLHHAGFLETSHTIVQNFPLLFSPISYKRTHINIGSDAGDFQGSYFTKADSDQDRPNF